MFIKFFLLSGKKKRQQNTNKNASMILVPKSFFISFSLDFKASHQRVYWRCHICHF